MIDKFLITKPSLVQFKKLHLYVKQTIVQDQGCSEAIRKYTKEVYAHHQAKTLQQNQIKSIDPCTLNMPSWNCQLKTLSAEVNRNVGNRDAVLAAPPVKLGEQSLTWSSKGNEV